MIYRIKIRKSIDGRSNRNNHTNMYYVKTAADVTSQSIRDTMVALANAEKLGHYDFVHFMDANAQHVLNDDHTVGTGRFKSIELGGVGARVSAGKERTLKEVALLIERDLAEGRNGVIKYRGALMEEDLIHNVDGSVSLANPGTFGINGGGGGTLIGALNAALPSGVFVIPQLPKYANLSSRLVLSHVGGGVGLVQVDRKNNSIEYDEARLAQRKLNAFASKIKKLRDQAVNGILSGELLATATAIFQAAIAFYNALSVLIRGRVRLPALLILAP
jgi:hypothetical protein